ncbi:MAG: ATP-binding protein [Marinicellaceae bacterium]
MLNKLLNFVRTSSLAKYFIVGLIIAIVNSISGHFTVLLLAASLSGLLFFLLKIPFLEDKLTYDQRQSTELNILLLNSILWGIYLWKDLHEFPQAYSLTFALLIFSIFNLFKTLKQRLYLLIPLVLAFVILSIFVQFPAITLVAATTVLFVILFLINESHLKQVGEKTIDPTNNDSTSKLEMVGELDDVRIENKQLKEHLKQIEIDLSAAEMAKMEFLATMSHEIRTPLNGIIPLLDILLDSELSDFQRDYLSTAHISAIQMQKLIDDLLDYSKVEAGKLTVETRGLKIPRIMQAVNASYKQAAQKKNLKLEVNVHKNISPLLRGDPTRLRQVLSNLVSNAIKFSSYGTISLNVKKLKDFPNKEIIRFEVVDQGIGLDKETSDNIFLPFTQEDGSSTRKFGGTGLGLAISKKIVELMQGSIYVESQKGKGSNFYFDLPLLKSVGETTVGTSEASGYQAILVNTNPLLFNKISQKLKSEEVPFQKALGLSQAYDIFASINKVSTKTKHILMFIDFETAGKQVRGLCNDITKDNSMENLYACIFSERESIAGIPKSPNIKLLNKDDSIGALLNSIEVSQASQEAADIIDSSQTEELSSDDQIEEAEIVERDPVDNDKLIPEILLVEDNEVNLKVAEKLIQYIGYPFDFAMNGQEALEKVKQNRYRMILMDCQMPVMDGYRSTAKIRDYETAAGLNRTPILAMTANAMLGDKEKCLNAGMDDYMSKPLNRYILEKTLKKWDPLAKTTNSTKPSDSVSEDQANSQEPEQTEPVAQEQKSSHQTPESSVSEINRNQSAVVEPRKPQPVVEKKVATPGVQINQKWLSTKTLESLKEFMGSEIIQLLDMFEQETPTILRKMRAALETKNTEEVQKMAHMLKSTSANIGGNGLSFFSRKMELAANSHELKQMPIIFDKIKKAYMLTSKEITKYIKTQQ